MLQFDQSCSCVFACNIKTINVDTVDLLTARQYTMFENEY